MLGILPFALFVYFSVGQSDEPEVTPDVLSDETFSTASVQLAFPFGGPPPPPIETVAENVPLEIPETTVPATPKQCSNGKDDDRDGRKDFPADPGCTSRNDSTESPNPAPKPTSTKAAVPGPSPVAPTTKPASTSPTPPRGKTACTNGIDDDRDGLIDGKDPGCDGGTLDFSEQDPPPPSPSPKPSPTPSPSVSPEPTATASATPSGGTASPDPSESSPSPTP